MFNATYHSRILILVWPVCYRISSLLLHPIPVQVGLSDGATLLTGGRRPPNCPEGYFIEPTVFINVKPHMRIWKEEVFGPVLSGTACLPVSM